MKKLGNVYLDTTGVLVYGTDTDENAELLDKALLQQKIDVRDGKYDHVLPPKEV